MPTASATQHGIDPAASPTSIPRMEVTQQLSTQTMAWLADRPHTRTLVRSVWSQLTEWERAPGQDPGVIAALRFILIDHQPLTRTGRCRTCPRFSWQRWWRRRRVLRWVWFTLDLETQRLVASNNGRHRKPNMTQLPGTGARSPGVDPFDAAPGIGTGARWRL
jgi:hypothetical protein